MEMNSKWLFRVFVGVCARVVRKLHEHININSFPLVAGKLRKKFAHGNLHNNFSFKVRLFGLQHVC